MVVKLSSNNKQRLERTNRLRLRDENANKSEVMIALLSSKSKLRVERTKQVKIKGRRSE